MRSLLPSAVRLLILIHVCCCTRQKVIGQAPLIDSIINPASLRQVVTVLAADSLEGRFSGTKHALMAADFIAKEFKNAGAVPFYDDTSYMKSFLIPGQPFPAMNVIAKLEGKVRPDELIIFCAHYDHAGTRSNNPSSYAWKTMSRDARNTLGTNWDNTMGSGRKDTIFNGANDNASGTSALIHIARYFGLLKNNERTIVFIAFSGEELGLLGSKEFAASLNPETVKAVINIEMLGRPPSQNKYRAYVTGYDLSDVQKLLNRRLFESDAKLYGQKYFIDDRYADQKLFRRSDNYPFAERGVPAHTIMASSPDDKYYHSTNDEVATLDFEFMSTLVKAIVISSKGLIQGTDTPTRIKSLPLEE